MIFGPETYGDNGPDYDTDSGTGGTPSDDTGSGTNTTSSGSDIDWGSLEQ